MAGNHMALDIRIAGRYRLGRKIGSGSFGDIYLGACRPGRRSNVQIWAYYQQEKMLQGPSFWA